MKFVERVKYAQTNIGKELFLLMEKKKSNLFVAADLTSSKEVLSLADKVGPYIAGIKTHVDILEDFTPDFTKSLVSLSQKHGFLIFEDRKFADIGNTVKAQYQGGIFKISDWAHIVNAHALPGPGIIKGLKEIGLKKNRALLLLAEMSPEKTLAKGDYTKATVQFALEHPDFVAGFIALKKLTDDPGFITMTPGVHLQKGSDHLGQVYRTIEDIIIKNQSDVIIVGRDICLDENPEEKAKLYQNEAWSALEKR